MTNQANTDPVTFPEKWAKVLKELPEFKDNADAMSVDDLKKLIVACEGNIFNIEKEKEDDTKLAGAKELVKEYSAPYRDAIKVQTAKVKYALFLMDSKGTALGDKP